MTVILSFLLALGLSLILTPAIISLAKKYKLVDDPRRRPHPATIHKRIIPRAGGVAIFLAFLITALLTLPMSQKLLGVILGGLILIAVGIIDDRRDLKSYWKILAQILAALIVVGSGIGISFITNPFSLLGLTNASMDVIRLDEYRIFFDFFGPHSIIILADLFALFWIVWVINMVNFSSGVDGQMPGIVLITLMVIFAASLRFPGDQSQMIVSALSLIGAGATLGFLFSNFYPAKIFPGDSGSYFLGFLVATLAILSGAKVGTAILVMAIPLLDGVFTVIRRLAEGKSPFVGDRKHLHHRLLELGWGQRRIALFYYLVCAILGAAALTLHSAEKLFAAVIVAIIVLGGLLWLNMTLPIEARK